MRMQPRERALWLTLDLVGLVVFVAYFAGGPSWLLPVGFAALLVGGGYDRSAHPAWPLALGRPYPPTFSGADRQARAGNG